MTPQETVPSLICERDLKRLLRRCLKIDYSSKLESLPRDEPIVESYMLVRIFDESTAGLFLKVMNALRVELVPHHCADLEVITEFWRLFYDVNSDTARYRDKSQLVEVLNDFQRRIKPPLIDFDVAYAIEYLDLGETAFSLGPVTILKPSEETLAAWSWNFGPWNWEDSASKVGAMAMSTIRVQAANGGLAFQTGKPAVLEALVVLRVAALSGLSNQADIDERFQWKLNGQWLAWPTDSKRPKGRYTRGTSRQFRPLVTDLSIPITKGLSRTQILDLVDDRVQLDIRQRLRRAVRWLSYSAVHQDDDYKIVDLCTALESMLLPNYTGGRKGHLIALRYNLLGGYMNPSGMKWFYELRSNVVHGSALDIVGGRDIWLLRLECYSVLTMLLSRARANPDTQTLEELFGSIESPEAIQQFIDRCNRGIYRGPGTSALRKFARYRLKQQGI